MRMFLWTFAHSLRAREGKAMSPNDFDKKSYDQITLIYRILWVIPIILVIIGSILIGITKEEVYRIDEVSRTVYIRLVYPYQILGSSLFYYAFDFLILGFIIRYLRNKMFMVDP